MRPIHRTAAAAMVGLGLVLAGEAAANSLEGLERERALFLHTFLAANLTPAEREARIAESTYRLVGLERRVLRDQSLIGAMHPVVRVAFHSYDLTFLVHASAEKALMPADLWLEELGLSTAAIAQAKVRKR